MQKSSVRELINSLLTPNDTFSVGVARPNQLFPKTIALGIGLDGKLAVRCFGGRNQSKIQQAFVELISKQAKNETDVRYSEMPCALPPVPSMMSGEKLANQGRCRPLKIGWSVAHKDVTAGTITCFVEKDGKTMLMSNSHVVANCNSGKKGDEVLQQGPYDGGKLPKDKIGTLYEAVKLKKNGNKVDAAVVLLDSGMEVDLRTIDGFGKFGGKSDAEVDVGMVIQKFGRTTGNTIGKVTAIEVSNLRVNYGEHGVLSWDNQIEVTKEGGSILLGGDSGSCLLNEDNEAVGLLYAGNTVQGYANDFNDVVEQLKIKVLK
jgi:hypothetical protein